MTRDEESTPLGSTRRGYMAIDPADEIDVTSYDSFPASDPPSWIATGIGSPHEPEPRDPGLPDSIVRQNHEQE